MIKQKKGYSLGVLVITIAVMIILTTTVLLSFKNMTSDKDITNFMNDLTEVEEFVKEYYGEKHILPVLYDDNQNMREIESGDYEKIVTQANTKDTGKYYFIDLNKFERINLQNKKRGYVLNGDSLRVFVTKPIEYQGVKYYTITDELKGIDKTYNDNMNFEVKISGNPLIWTNRAKLILSVPGLGSITSGEASGESYIAKGWTFKYYTGGPIKAEEFKNKGNLFLYGETIEISENGIVSFYIENPEGYVSVINEVITKIDDINPIIELVGDNKTGRLIILDEETGINPDKLLYKISGDNTIDINLEKSTGGREILFYGTRYAKYIEKYNLLKAQHDDLNNNITDLITMGSGEEELTVLNSELNNIKAQLSELNEENRDFNDGTIPYGDEDTNIVVYVQDYTGNETRTEYMISRKVLINSNLIDFEAKPLENSTFSIVKTSEYTNSDVINLRMRAQGATHMLITLDSTISPTEIENYEAYESSNGHYELDISSNTSDKVTVYAYFTAGEYDNGNLIYNSFSDNINIDKDAPTNDAPTLEISNNLELSIKTNQKDIKSGISKIEYGYSKSEKIEEFVWVNSISKIEDIVEAGEKYYIRTRATDKLGNGPTISKFAILICPSEKIMAIPNSPKIGNLQAITWNSNLEEIEIDSATLKDKNGVTKVWYDYIAGNGIDDTGTAKWANAKSEDGSYWVWIPRYAYRIVYYTDESKTEIKGYFQKSPKTGNLEYYAADEKTKVTEEAVKSQYGNIDIVFLYGTEDDKYLDFETRQTKSLLETGDLYSKYIVHPAFNTDISGTANQLGSFSNRLTGIWVAKFEASRKDATYLEEGISESIKVIPSVRSIDNITVSDAYNYSKNINPNMNAHLMKNSEWGAVAYLAYSAYGRNGEEIKSNLSSDMITGGGFSKTGSNYAVPTKDKFENDYGYKTMFGFETSTTKNIYGVYDLAGGAEEYVASYINNGKLDSNYTNSLKNASTAYSQIYTPATTETSVNNYLKNSGVYGDAVYEISTSETTAFEENRINYPTGENAIFVRGGSYSKNPGMFTVNNSSGAATEKISFRPVLAP